MSAAGATSPSDVFYEIAERELDARRLPFIVVRTLPDGKTERIRISTLP